MRVRASDADVRSLKNCSIEPREPHPVPSLDRMKAEQGAQMRLLVLAMISAKYIF